MSRAWECSALTSTEIDRPLARQTRHLCVLRASARTKLSSLYVFPLVENFITTVNVDRPSNVSVQVFMVSTLP